MKKLRLSALLMTTLICTSCNFYEVEDDESSTSLAPSISENPTASVSRKDKCEGLTQVVGEFTTQGLDGKTYDQTLFAGKLTLLNLWGTFCGPCVKEMPYLGEFHRYFAEVDFQVVGVLSDIFDPSTGDLLPNKKTQADAIVKQTGVTYPSLYPCAGLRNFIASTEYIPYSIFIDEHGHQLGEAITGSMSESQWNKAIVNAINLYM